MKKIRIILPLLIGLSTLASCDNSKKYTVTFYDYSASSSYTQYAVSSTIKVKEGNVIDYPENPTRKTFRRFVGWTTKNDGTGFFDFNKALTSDVTLYANYAKEDERVLFADYDDGIYRWAIKPKGSTIKKAEIPHDEVEGWEFTDWYLNKGFSLKAPDEISLDGDDQYIYALWNKKQFAVYYHYNGGRFPKITSKTLVNYGECAIEFVPPHRPEQIFDYWCSDEELTTKFDFSTPIKESTHLYGKWQVTSTL